jgi:hypothetical protein
MRLTRLLRLAALHLEDATEEEIKQVVQFMTGKVKGMSDYDLCYAFYVSVGIVDYPFVKWTKGLISALAAEYQKRLTKWMKFALYKRAGLAGGQKELEAGISTWVEALPEGLWTGTQPDLSKYVKANEFLDPQTLYKVGKKVYEVALEDAQAAGVIPETGVAQRAAAKTGLTMKWDAKGKVWYVPYSEKTYEMRSQMHGYGLKKDKSKKRWYTETLTPMLKQDFDFKPTPDKVVEQWFWKTWWPKNHKRFTTVFTDWAMKRLKSKSNVSGTAQYGFVFSPKRVKRLVRFKRDIRTMDDVLEELRYRYIGRHGREQWLQVMDLFKDFLNITPTATKKLIRAIDLLNGMQHSNGLFMEQFPPEVVKWYKAFLNAKFSSPDPEDLARYIKDRDFRDLMMFMAPAGKARPLGKEHWSQEPGIWHTVEKDIEPADKDWREKGYPKQRGVKPPKRLDPEVQKGLLPKSLRKRDPFLQELWERM